MFKRRGDVASGRSNWAVILAWGYNLKAVWPDRESKIVEAGGTYGAMPGLRRSVWTVVLRATP